METFENISHSFANRLLITMAFKVARVGAFLADINKRFVLKRELTTQFCWSNVTTNRFHSVPV